MYVIDKNIMLLKSAYRSKKYLELLLADVSLQGLPKILKEWWINESFDLKFREIITEHLNIGFLCH